MNKKLFALAMGCVLSMSSAYAGFYAGASAGFQSNVQVGGEETIWEGDLGVNTHNIHKGYVEGSGAVGSLFLGYEMNNLYSFANVNALLGMEINGEWTNISIYEPNSNRMDSLDGSGAFFNNLSYRRLTQTGALGITLHPGLSFANSSKLYGILGYEAGRFKAVNNSSTQINELDGGVLVLRSGDLNLHKGRWLNGFRYGLGLMYPVTAKIGIRAEFSQTEYGKTIKLSGLDAVNSIDVDQKFKPKSRIASIGLVWNFDEVAAPKAYVK
ncbi:MAG: outer membrane beta-barrel protein [Legionella sp.]|nr:outer membrane beta-barrel protein [Legionella sp.]